MNKNLFLLFALLFATGWTTAWIGKYNLYELPTPKAPTLTLLAGGSLPVDRTYCIKVAASGRGTPTGYYAEWDAMTMLSRPSNESNCVTTTTGFQNINVTFEDCGADCKGYLFYLNTTIGGYSPRPNYWNVTETNRVNLASIGACGLSAETAFSKANSTTLYWGNFSTITMGASAGWVDYYPSGIPFINMTGGTTTNPITPQDIYNWLMYLNSSQDIVDCSPKSGIREYGGTWECGTFKFRASLGEMGTVSYGTVFNIPKNIIVDQEWGKLTFLSGGNFTIGTYTAATDTASDGGVYRRTACYPVYNQIASYDWNGAYLGGGYTMLGADYYNGVGLGVQGHMNQFLYIGGTSTPLGRMIATVYYGAGRMYSNNGNYTIWRNSVFMEARESGGGKNGFSSTNIKDVRSGTVGNYLTYPEGLFYNTIFSGAYAIAYILTPYGSISSNTTIDRFIDCEWTGTSPAYAMGLIQVPYSTFNSTAYSLIATREYSLKLRIVDSQTGNAIPSAEVSIYNASGNNLGSYAATPLTLVGRKIYEGSTLFGNILYVQSTAGMAMGTNLYIGNEYLNVTSVINSTAAYVTRGLFGSRLNSLSGYTGAGDAAYLYSLNVYWGNGTWVTNTTGELPLLNLVDVREQYLGSAINTVTMNFNETQSPFVITVNASGYENMSYYYAPTAKGAFTLSLVNASSSTGGCSFEYDAIVIKQGAGLILHPCGG